MTRPLFPGHRAGNAPPPVLPSRRDLLGLAAVACMPRGALAAPDRGMMMWDYFMSELGGADERRRQALAIVRDPKSLAALQEKVKRVMQAGIGPFPERTPLHAQQVGEIRKPGYVIEKIIFESQPDYFVTANLYRPQSTGTRLPAVVQSCGHYNEGKAAAHYQRVCIGLAKKGLVALVFDPMGQGERWMFSPRGQEPSSATAEHVLAGRPTLLLRRTLANYRVWDFMRALDYLETRPDVDPARMGMLGHSGGGMMTLVTSPLEPRIRAAMSCCAVTSFYHKTKALLMADPEQIVPGIYANGVDHPELIAAVAPRPFLIGAVLRDYVPLDGTRRTYERSEARLRDAGRARKHRQSGIGQRPYARPESARGLYGWMLKHLAGETGDTREPEMEVESDRDLWCTPTGRVMDLKNARSIFDLNLAYAHELARQRAGLRAASLRPLLAVAADPKPEQGIDTPTTLLEGAKGRGILIVVASAQGRNSATAGEISGTFVKAGYSVLGVDLRGWGETACTKPKQEKFAWDEFFAWRALEMGRPLLGMRIQDLLAVARQMAKRYRRVYMVGIEAAGLAALHAAAMDDSIAGVATYRALDSYQDVMDHLHSTEPVSSLVWGALTRYDLPQLAEAIHPRPYIAVNALDSFRHPVSGAILPAEQAAQQMLKGLRLL